MVLKEFISMAIPVNIGKNAAMNAGMQSFDTAIKNLRKPGDFGYPGNGNTCFMKQSCSTAGGYNFNFQFCEFFCEFQETGLIRDTYQCAFNCHDEIRCSLFLLINDMGWFCSLNEVTHGFFRVCSSENRRSSNKNTCAGTHQLRGIFQGNASVN